MSKERFIVLSAIHGHLTKAEAARRYEVTWRWVHTLITRSRAAWRHWSHWSHADDGP